MERDTKEATAIGHIMEGSCDHWICSVVWKACQLIGWGEIGVEREAYKATGGTREGYFYIWGGGGDDLFCVRRQKSKDSD